jgi:hypothetical protein
MSPIGEFTDPVPTIQSPTAATRRIAGFHIVSVQIPQKGFGAAPSSIRTQYENSVVI